MKNITIAACAASWIFLAAATVAHAQSSPPTKPTAQTDAQEQRRAQDRERALREQQERAPDVRLPAPATTPTSLVRLPDSESPCFSITQLDLKVIASDPARAADFAWALDAASGPGSGDSPIGRCVGAQGVGLLIKRMQDAVVARGLVTTRVLAEPQDMSRGTLVFTVIPGRIRAIRFAPAANDGLGQRGNAWTALPARPGDLLNLRDIEQGLENFKRVPTAEADIQIEAATTDGTQLGLPGQSDLVISYRQALPFRVSLSLDDSGSKATGQYQGGVTLSYDNALTLNDLFYVSLNHNLGASGERGTQGHTAHYSLPFGDWLLGATASDSRYHQAVAGASQTYVYAGESSNLDVKLSRLVYRDASRKTTVGLRAFRRSSSNFIDDTEIEVQHRVVGGFEASVNHREFIGDATVDLGLAHKRGTGDFGSLPAPEEAFGEGTSRLRITTADLAVNAPFKALGQAFRYTGTLRTQYNQTALTPQDRFAIGGRYTVRGFDGESSLSAERGLLLRNELSAPLGSSGQETYVGLDYGRVGGPTSAYLAGKSLTGAVIGLRGAVRSLQYDVFIGAPVKKPEFFRTARMTAGFSLNTSF